MSACSKKYRAMPSILRFPVPEHHTEYLSRQYSLRLTLSSSVAVRLPRQSIMMLSLRSTMLSKIPLILIICSQYLLKMSNVLVFSSSLAELNLSEVDAEL